MCSFARHSACYTSRWQRSSRVLKRVSMSLLPFVSHRKWATFSFSLAYAACLLRRNVGARRMERTTNESIKRLLHFVRVLRV